MKPPTISEDEEAEKAAEAGSDLSMAGPIDGVPSTEDREVAAWVKGALEKKRQGKLAEPKKPALHEAPLDAVPGSPLLMKEEVPAPADEEGPHKPNPGVRIRSPELTKAHVESVDFASNVEEKDPGSDKGQA